MRGLEERESRNFVSVDVVKFGFRLNRLAISCVWLWFSLLTVKGFPLKTYDKRILHMKSLT